MCNNVQSTFASKNWTPELDTISLNSNTDERIGIINVVFTLHIYIVANQCPQSFWSYIVCDQDPSDSKSNQLHIDIFRRFCFYSFEVYSTDSSKLLSKFLEVLNFNRLYLSNSTVSSATNRRFFLDIAAGFNWKVGVRVGSDMELGACKWGLAPCVRYCPCMPLFNVHLVLFTSFIVEIRVAVWRLSSVLYTAPCPK